MQENLEGSIYLKIHFCTLCAQGTVKKETGSEFQYNTKVLICFFQLVVDFLFANVEYELGEVHRLFFCDRRLSMVLDRCGGASRQPICINLNEKVSS